MVKYRLASLPRLDRKIRKCQMPMSLFNPQCTGYWDASFEINNNQVQWKAKPDPNTILYNYMLPPDHMTRCVIPLFAARGLLADLELRVATKLSHEYQDSRQHLSAMLDYDMRCCILFLARKRPDLQPFEVLWCAVSGVLKVHKPSFDRYIQAPAKIRQRVRRDGIAAFQRMIKAPDFVQVDKSLWNAMRVLEIYTRPLVTGENAYLWIDSFRLENIDVIYDLRLDGAKARKKLFDYLEERHPGGESIWHSLVQNFHSHDVIKFPEYATRPRSVETIFTWVEFFTEARQGVILKEMDFVGYDPVEGHEQKKPKKKKSRKRKGAKSEEQPTLLEQSNEKESPVSKEDSAPQDHPVSHERPPLKDETTSLKEPVTQEQHTSLEQAIGQEEPQTKKQRLSRKLSTTPSPCVPTPLSTLEESEEEREQKLSTEQLKKQRKKQARWEKKHGKTGKSDATKQASSTTVKESLPSVTAKTGDGGDSVTGNADKDSDSAIDNSHDRDGTSVINAGGELDGHLSAADSIPNDEAPTNQETVQELPSNRYEVLMAKPSKPAGKSARKLAFHADSEDDMKKAMEESLLNDPGSWSKVQGRAKLRPKQKQKQRTDDRKSIQDAYREKGYASAVTNVEPAAKRAEVQSAKPWVDYAEPWVDHTKSQPTRLSALIPGESSSEPIKELNSTARGQPTSWSALFKSTENDTGRKSPQEAAPSTNAIDTQPRTATATEDCEPIQESAQSASPHILAQSEPPVRQEQFKNLKPSKVVAGAASSPTSGTEDSESIKETVRPASHHTTMQSELPVVQESPRDLEPSKVVAGAGTTSTSGTEKSGSTKETVQPVDSQSIAQQELPPDRRASGDFTPPEDAAGAGSTSTSGTENSGPIKETLLTADPRDIAQSEHPTEKEKPMDLAPCEDAAGAKSTPAPSAKNESSTTEIAQTVGSHSFAQTRIPMDEEAREPRHRRKASSPPPLSSHAPLQPQLLVDEEAPGYHHSHEDGSPPPASPHAHAQSQPPVDEEEPKDENGHEDHTESLPEDDTASQPSTVVDSAMSHVEQWLASKYAAAFAGLTQAEIDNAHWRPQQSTSI
ncbi:hypothetical protein J4E93_004977 [Alternaria ventricosa]|uniref:uncharacterized protein n=1 Tax=Alternaria ventricosa TaxID=1187951 RepID=UPI0020C58D5B|nr:uncharacterized protein J4E93_004977 [Alternaria ventricosa]KAI4646754.1 hypothetical protein J4E93_004977 [Alternaria ventricosa]